MIETVRYMAAIIEVTPKGDRVVHTCSTAELNIRNDINRTVQEHMESLQGINPDKTYEFVPDYGELYSKQRERVA